MNKVFIFKKEDWLALGKNDEMYFYKYIPGNFYIELPKRPYYLNKEEQKKLIYTIENHK